MEEEKMHEYGEIARSLRRLSREHMAYVASLTEEERRRKSREINKQWNDLQNKKDWLLNSAYTEVEQQGLAVPAVERAAPAAVRLGYNREVNFPAVFILNPEPISQTHRAGSSSNLMTFKSTEKGKKRKYVSKNSEAKKKSRKEEEEPVQDSKIKNIVVEYCKQSGSFKRRAKKVKRALKKVVPGVKVTLNPVEPRLGCFEIREERGETFISLLDMVRPFTQMKQLDMKQVTADIIEQLK